VWRTYSTRAKRNAVVALKRFFDFACLDAAGADTHALDTAVNLGADPLDIRLKGALGLAGNTLADPAFLLRLTAPFDLMAEVRVFPANFANP